MSSSKTWVKSMSWSSHMSSYRTMTLISDSACIADSLILSGWLGATLTKIAGYVEMFIRTQMVTHPGTNRDDVQQLRHRDQHVRVPLEKPPSLSSRTRAFSDQTSYFQRHLLFTARCYAKR